jgi:hypothetical protein
VKWTSWGFLAIIGSLAFLALYLKDREIKAGVDRLYRMQFPRRSALHSPDALPFLYERGSPRLRAIAYSISRCGLSKKKAPEPERLSSRMAGDPLSGY